MTTSRETVPNKALSGAEVKELIRLDLERLLANEGLLSDYIGYGRLAYDLILRLHLDNAMVPESQSSITSRPAGVNTLVEHPTHIALESPPLPDPSADAVVHATQSARKITSPNAERIRTGMPVPVDVKQHDGTVTTEQVKYPPNPDLGPGDIADSDVTEQAEAEWKAK